MGLAAPAVGLTRRTNPATTGSPHGEGRDYCDRRRRGARDEVRERHRRVGQDGHSAWTTGELPDWLGQCASLHHPVQEIDGEGGHDPAEVVLDRDPVVGTTTLPYPGDNGWTSLLYTSDA